MAAKAVSKISQGRMRKLGDLRGRMKDSYAYLDQQIAISQIMSVPILIVQSFIPFTRGNLSIYSTLL